MSRPEPTPLERLAMKWEARRQAGGGPSRPVRRGVPLQTRPTPVTDKTVENKASESSDDDSSSDSDSEGSSSSSSDTDSSSSSSSSSSGGSSSSGSGEVRKPGRHKRKFKPNTHMLSALVKGQIRTNDRMDREQTENAQERLDTMDGGRSFTKVRIMTSYLTEHGSTGIASDERQQHQAETTEQEEEGGDWGEWEKQKRLKFGS
ncbi:hypothetical protein FOL47_003121 [Perkinsus chesapeaki]|uniref:Uncharacterized protein n=1 Tax=Perkinsus chesapeaki TaxID=330153 RepID=A0A7J6MA71_PERCH|nr:hypothetical protein FOL47_003121 [Perkinsus chesapeaki]